MASPDARPISPIEMAVLEHNATALGVTLDSLMENAGRAVAEAAQRRLPPPPSRVAIVCGAGNNGGDGACAAFYLKQWGYEPEVWYVRPGSEIRSGSARRCFERIEHKLQVKFRPPTAEELSGAPLVIDALLGTGQSGELRSAYRDAVLAVNASGAPTLSVDLPSGLGATPTVRPSWTIALSSVKSGMTKENSGEIEVRDIGIPEVARRRTGPGEFLFFPPLRAPAGHVRRARILVVGGGPYAGAPALAALAALRSGTERATVLVPGSVAATVQGFSPNLVVRAVGKEFLRPDDAAAVVAFAREFPVTALVIGMGAGRDPTTIEAVRSIIEALARDVSIVVDADGLAAVAPESKGAGARSASRVVATPNQGEYHRVFGGPLEGSWEDRLEDARLRATRSRITLVVKGESDLLTDGVVGLQNLNHPTAITVSGVGDVLAGVIGSLMGQGLDGLSAARLGTYWVGEAGNRAAESKGFGLTATDVLEELPGALVDGLRRVRDAP